MAIAAPAKFITIHGLTGKLEPTYGAGVALTIGTDGLMLDENPTLEISYANDGMRPAPPGTLGQFKKVVPSGQVGKLPIKFAARGPGIAYTASTVWSNLRTILRLSGFDVVVSVVGGSESETFTPTPGPGGYASGDYDLYSRGEKHSLTGVLGDGLVLTATGGDVLAVDATLNGLLANASDVAVPTIVDQTRLVDPPKAVNLAFTWAGTTFASLNIAVRSIILRMNRTIGPRLDINVGGHAGFAPGHRAPELDVVVEAPAFSGQDPYGLARNATAGAWSYQVGAVQYDKFTISGAVAQLKSPPKWSSDAAGVALSTYTFLLSNSTPNANDDVQILAN